jgi:uncharacterized membrane protein
MTERTAMRFNPITTYAGIFSGVGAALWTMFEYAMGWHNEHLETGATTGFVAIIFPIAAILWALRATKRSHGDQLSLKQALMCGIAVSAISAAIGVIFFYIYYSSINPAFLDLMRARGQAVDVTTQLVAVVMGSFIFGILLSAVAGFFMRTRGEAAK